MIPGLAGVCGLLVILQLPPAGEPSERLTVSEFVGAMEAIAYAIEATDATAAAGLGRSIPSSMEVFGGGETYQVKLDWVRRPMLAARDDTRAWLSRRGELASRLRAIGREAAMGAAAPSPAPGARQALSAVLAQKRFQRAQAGAWQAELQRRIGRWLTDLWERTLGKSVARRSVALVIAWTAAMAAVVVLIVWLVDLAVRRRDDRPLTVGPIALPRKPGHVLGSEAAALIEAGQIREAARVAYRAAVHRLEEEGALRVDEARTPREYLRLLPPVHRRHATLSALTITFERIWYGSRAAAPDEGDKILAHLQDLGCLYFHRAK